MEWLNDVVAWFQGVELQTFVNIVLTPLGLGTLPFILRKLFTNRTQQFVSASMVLVKEVDVALGKFQDAVDGIFDVSKATVDQVVKLKGDISKLTKLSTTILALANIPLTQKQELMKTLLDIDNVEEKEFNEKLLSIVNGDVEIIKTQLDENDALLDEAEKLVDTKGV